MRKFLAVLKREYVQRVRAKMFIVSTIMIPLVMSLFGIVPALILSIDVGGPLKVAVVDQTGRLYGPLYDALRHEADLSAESDNDAIAEIDSGNSNEGAQRGAIQGLKGFALEEIRPEGRSLEDMRSELDGRLREKKLDGYLVLPPDLLNQGGAEFFNRNTGDVITLRLLKSALNRAVQEQRLIEARVELKTRQALSKRVDLQAVKIGAGVEERDSGGGFVLVFGVGFVMYLTILMYGQVVLGAIIEEKETRIAEILFSSVKPFTLMIGKLVGVSLVALTQIAIWGLAFAAFALYGVGFLASKGVEANLPGIPISHYLYFGLFFLLGFFIYSTLYVLVGSMVTTAQEGGQLAMPIILVLVIAFYLFFPVSRSPDSPFAFWVSMFPFFAPVTMLVRIVTQTPPFWQIALSLLLGFGAVAFLTWVGARIYRVGMLMYGKRASIPEVIRWVRQG